MRYLWRADEGSPACPVRFSWPPSGAPCRALSRGHHGGYTCRAPRRAVLGVTEGPWAKEAEVTAADLLLVAPWLIFGGALAAICYGLLSRRSASGRHRRDS